MVDDMMTMRTIVRTTVTSGELFDVVWKKKPSQFEFC